MTTPETKYRVCSDGYCLPPSYNAMMTPPTWDGGGGSAAPLEIQVGFEVHDIKFVGAMESLVGLRIIMHLFWTESRLLPVKMDLENGSAEQTWTHMNLNMLNKICINLVH